MRDHALMNAHSEDLRKKIVEALGPGTTKKSEAARSFGVSRSSVKRYVKLAEEGRPLAPKKRPGLKPKLDEAARRLPEEDLEERPAATTLRQGREFLRSVAGVSVSESTVRAGRSDAWGGAEKRSLAAAERDEFLRAAWRAMVAGGVDAERPVCSSRRWAPTSRCARSTLGRAGANGPPAALRATGARTSRCSPASLPLQHHCGWERSLPGGRRRHHEGGVRGLPGAGARANPTTLTDRGDGQPLRPRGWPGEEDRRGPGGRARLPAALLAGL